MRFVKKYSPLLTVVLYPHREGHCIKQRHLSQSLSSVFVSGFVFLMKAMTKSLVMMRQFLKAMNCGWEVKSCLPVEFLLSWVTRKEPVKEHFASWLIVSISSLQ